MVNSYTTDGLDNLASRQLPTGATTGYAYTDTDNPFAPSQITSPQGGVTTLDYDAAGNLASVTDPQTVCPGGCTIGLSRNVDGTIASVTGPRGYTTVYGYDLDGNRTSISPPDPQGDTTFTYDGLSRVDTVSLPNGTSMDYDYDTFDRVTRITYGDNSTVTYTYDDVGNRTGRVDDTGTTTTSYDELNRMTGESFPGSRTTSYGYDDVGNLTSLTDPAGTVTYGYNTVNEVTSMVEPGSATTTFGYDAGGYRDEIAYPNGVTIDISNDASGRPTDITATDTSSVVLARRSYTYTDPTSTEDTLLRQSVTDENGHTTVYSHDTADRLVSAVTRDATSTLLDELTFGYDPAGNLLERDDDGETTWFAYDAADQLTDTMGELGDVLLVVGDPATLTSGDTALKDRLQTTLGGSVTVRDDAASELTSGYDLVVISESVSSTTVGTRTTPTRRCRARPGAQRLGRPRPDLYRCVHGRLRSHHRRRRRRGPPRCRRARR